MRKGGAICQAVSVNRKRAAVQAAALCLVLLGSPRAHSQSAQDVETAAAQTIRRHDIQADLPKDVEIKEDWTFKFPDFDAVTWILWCSILLGVVFVLYPLGDQLFRGRWRRPEDWDGQIGQAGSAAQRSTLEFASANAEELAQQGRYREAIHLLLLHALNEMRRRLKAQFADSLTSREILRGANLAPAGGAALQDMIGRVEKSYFGEYPAAAEDYTACRASFDTFVHHLNASRNQ
jgi:hypothetical protein